METIIFYDIKSFEKEFFEKELSGQYNLKFEENGIFSDTQLSSAEENSEIISVFTVSRLTADILSKFKKLKLILSRSVGYSHIDLDYCREKNIVVANTPHYGDYTVAEYSFGILLNLIRRICYAANELKNGDMYPETFGIELCNKTIGIIGIGSIGSKSVKIAKGFSMNIVCYDVSENIELIEKYGVKYVSLETLCRISDFIMLHAPLNDTTYHMLDKSKIDLMKPNVVIVNTSRGELIDTEALYNALLENQIKGVALDVLEYEDTISNKRPGEHINLKNLRTSLINSKLLNLKNVIVTPHIAYDTKEAVNRILEITLQNLNQYSHGEDVKNSV